jgi:hypothetical protein
MLNLMLTGIKIAGDTLRMIWIVESMKSATMMLTNTAIMATFIGSRYQF